MIMTLYKEVRVMAEKQQKGKKTMADMPGTPAWIKANLGKKK